MFEPLVERLCRPDSGSSLDANPAPSPAQAGDPTLPPGPPPDPRHCRDGANQRRRRHSLLPCPDPDRHPGAHQSAPGGRRRGARFKFFALMGLCKGLFGAVANFAVRSRGPDWPGLVHAATSILYTRRADLELRSRTPMIGPDRTLRPAALEWSRGEPVPSVPDLSGPASSRSPRRHVWRAASWKVATSAPRVSDGLAGTSTTGRASLEL